MLYLQSNSSSTAGEKASKIVFTKLEKTLCGPEGKNI